LALEHSQTGESPVSNRPPPVPPENRTDKGPAGPAEPVATDTAPKKPVPDNLSEQGRQGNIKQNTSNRGYQQER
jgi:hypothetical protein